MGHSLEQMARSLVESGDYRVTSRLERQAEYHPPDNSPKLVAAVVDVETTGTNPDRDKIIELGICLFEYDPSDRADLQGSRLLGVARRSRPSDPSRDHEDHWSYR
jgi:DNA polymerase III epsilon subunit-like protein